MTRGKDEHDETSDDSDCVPLEESSPCVDPQDTDSAFNDASDDASLEHFGESNHGAGDQSCTNLPDSNPSSPVEPSNIGTTVVNPLVHRSDGRVDFAEDTALLC